MKIVVFHSTYGCETGCCGHIVALVAEAVASDPGFDPFLSDTVDESFEFAHPAPGETDQQFAQRLVSGMYGAAHVADLDWNNCYVVDD